MVTIITDRNFKKEQILYDDRESQVDIDSLVQVLFEELGDIFNKSECDSCESSIVRS